MVRSNVHVRADIAHNMGYSCVLMGNILHDDGYNGHITGKIL